MKMGPIRGRPARAGSVLAAGRDIMRPSEIVLFAQGLLLNAVKKWLFRLLVLPLLLGTLVAGGVVWWVNAPWH